MAILVRLRAIAARLFAVGWMVFWELFLDIYPKWLMLWNPRAVLRVGENNGRLPSR